MKSGITYQNTIDICFSLGFQEIDRRKLTETTEKHLYILVHLYIYGGTCVCVAPQRVAWCVCVMPSVRYRSSHMYMHIIQIFSRLPRQCPAFNHLN